MGRAVLREFNVCSNINYLGTLIPSPFMLLRKIAIQSLNLALNHLIMYILQLMQVQN